ncbi:MAG: T9SS type A sorting domain-containing protein [Bacteroidetes bacterium]|nr:T9SS type A sorting domain-containing protein [Bacteroidota bacterium]
MKTITPTLIIGTFLLLNVPAYAQSEGPMYPSSTDNEPYTYCSACAGAIWNNTSNISSSDGQFSDVQLQPFLNCFQSSCYRSRYLTCFDFGFNIPWNAEIKGIEVDVTGFCNMASAVLDCTIVLRQNSVSLSGNNQSNYLPWSTTNSERSYGGPNELWGLTWSPGDINSQDFGTYIKVYNPTLSSPIISVDCVSMTVTYAMTTGIYSQTSYPRPLRVSTNPFLHCMNITFDVPHENNAIRFYVYDLNGAEIFASVVEGANGGTFTQKVNTENFESGMYICTVIDGEKVYSAKTIIEN